MKIKQQKPSTNSFLANIGRKKKGLAMTDKNKPWDVTPERLAFLIKNIKEYRVCPINAIEAIEYSLAKWHKSNDGRGKRDCGCCNYSGKYSDDCDSCPINTSHANCCDGLVSAFWGEYCGDGSATVEAEAVYQFILGKYWEQKEKENENANGV